MKKNYSKYETKKRHKQHYNRQAKETNVIFVIINVLNQDNSNADLKMIKFM